MSTHHHTGKQQPIQRSSTTMLTLRHIAFTYPQSPEPLFSDVNLSLPNGWTAVVGDNGIGKSTLLRIACGFLAPDAGSVLPNPNKLVVQYCTQEVTGQPRNLEEFAADWSPQSQRLRRVLQIDDSWLYRFHTLSGGQAKRVQIACAMADSSDLLVLDEPTNHVDVATRKGIVAAMRVYRGIGVVISHDVALMDAVCERCAVFEKRHISGHNVTEVAEFPGNYSAVSTLLAQRDRSDQQTLRKAGEEVARLQSVQQQRFQKVQQVESTKRRSARINPKDHDARGRLHLAKATSLDAGVTSSYAQLKGRIADAQQAASGLSTAAKRYDGDIWIDAEASRRHELARLPIDEIVQAFSQRELEDVSLTVAEQSAAPSINVLAETASAVLSIGPTDHIAISGSNGIGKTTLIDVIRAHLPQDVPHLVIAQQTTSEDAERAMHRLTGLDSQRKATVLNAMAQLNADPSKLLADVSPSPGELRKLLLCLGLLDHPQLILMDEPTNHLDLHSKQALARTLASFPGALVVVSHDVWFLEQTATIRWQLSRLPSA